MNVLSKYLAYSTPDLLRSISRLAMRPIDHLRVAEMDAADAYLAHSQSCPFKAEYDPYDDFNACYECERLMQAWSDAGRARNAYELAARPVPEFDEPSIGARNGDRL